MSSCPTLLKWHRCSLFFLPCLLAIAVAAEGAMSLPIPDEAKSLVEEPPSSTAVITGQPFFVAVSVADVEASATWYQKTLGLKLKRSADLAERGIRVRLLTNDFMLLELIENREARSGSDIDSQLAKRYLVHGVFKTGFLVSDLDATIARLETAGVPLRGKTFGDPDLGLRSTQIEDPDGNILQLFERVAVE